MVLYCSLALHPVVITARAHWPRQERQVVRCVMGQQGMAGGEGGCVVFFFSSRRRHTRLSCDWSSDVCSSDLMIRHTRLSCDWSSDVCSSDRSEEHTSELQSHDNLVCRLLL